MDTREFEITVEETFEQVAHLIETGILNGVDVIVHEDQCRFAFDDGSAMQIHRDMEQRKLHFDAAGHRVASFTYNEVEEAWLEDETKQTLLTVLNRTFSQKYGSTVSLSD